MATKKRVVTLHLELDKKPEDLIVSLLKDWNKNAKRLDVKVRKRLGEGISYVATVEGEPIILEGNTLQKVFENSQEPLVIVITVKLFSHLSFSFHCLSNCRKKQQSALPSFCISERSKSPTIFPRGRWKPTVRYSKS